MKRLTPALIAALLLGVAPSLLGAIELQLNTSDASPQDLVVAALRKVPGPPGCHGVTFSEAPRVEEDRILIEGVSHSLPITCPLTPTENRSFLLPSVPVGVYTVEVVISGRMVDSASLLVRERTELFLWDQQFLVEVAWDDPRAGTGQGRAVPLTDDSGGFWFFEEENLEVTVKVIDGRAVNDHFWVFIASMTDVGFTLKVTRLDDPCLFSDPPFGADCATRTYVQAPGANRNFLDTEAFELPRGAS